MTPKLARALHLARIVAVEAVDYVLKGEKR